MNYSRLGYVAQFQPEYCSILVEVDRCVKRYNTTKRFRTDTHGIQFEYQSGMLFITLPSGRRLSYVKPRIGENKFGGESVTYEGVGATKKWERIESYGPKFVENIVQAVSQGYSALLCGRCGIIGCAVTCTMNLSSNAR